MATDRETAERMFKEISAAPMGARTLANFKRMVEAGDCQGVMRYLARCVDKRPDVGESIQKAHRVSFESKFPAVEAIFTEWKRLRTSAGSGGAQTAEANAGEDTHSRAAKAIAARLREMQGSLRCDQSGYVSDLRFNCVDGVSPEMFVSDFASGGGHELSGVQPKIHAAYSSAALAANVFARWRSDPSSLRLAGSSGFTSLRFEVPCSSGLRGTPPTLDVMIEGSKQAIAIESKCLEHTVEHDQSFAESYDAIADARNRSPWFEMISRIRREPRRFKYVNAAQLVKHYLGLAATGSRSELTGKSVTLVYLFWEPVNWSGTREFDLHRAEIQDFGRYVDGDAIAFRAQSYPELWAEWAALGEPFWLREHVEALRRKYLLAI